MSKPRVYVFGPMGLDYKLMFLRNGFTGSNNPTSADLLCLTGGADVCPSLYAEKTLPKTGCSIDRDKADIEITEMFLDKNLPMVGICRGGQFLNVLCGGKMWQDVDRHGRYEGHDLIDLETGEAIKVSSTHHQMMRPTLEATIVATANESTKKVAANDWWMANVSVAEGGQMPKGYVATELFDTEVCYYASKKALCFQPHPEYKGWEACEKYFFEVLKRHLDIAA